MKCATIFRLSAWALVILALAASANAAITITGAGWIVANGNPGASNAVQASIPGNGTGTPDFTFTSTGLQYSSYGNSSCATVCSGNPNLDQTINSWLMSLGSSGAATFSGAVNPILGAAASGTTVLSNGTTYGTIMRFDITGASFTTGQAFHLAHDDGVTILVGGSFDAHGNLVGATDIGGPLGVSPGPTSPTVNNFVYPASGPQGAQNAEFIYGECCTLPAVLQTDLVPFNVPEPSSIIFLGTVVLAIGSVLRRKIVRA